MAKKPIATREAPKKKDLSRGNENDRRVRVSSHTKPAWDDMSRPIHQIVPILFFAIAVFLIICFFGGGALIGELLRALFFGLFGRITASFLLPLALIFTCLWWRRKVRSHALISHFVIVFLLLSLFACMVRTVANDSEIIKFFDAEAYYTEGSLWESGGFIGNTFSFLLVNLIGKVGSYLLTAVIILVIAVLAFGFTPSVIAAKVRDRAVEKAKQKTEMRRIIREEEQAHKDELRRVKDENKLEEQRAAAFVRAEERRQRYEEEEAEKRIRNEERMETKRRRNEAAAEIKANKRMNRAQFKSEYDIALDDEDFSQNAFAPEEIDPTEEPITAEKLTPAAAKAAHKKLDSVVEQIDDGAQTYNLFVNNKEWDANNVPPVTEVAPQTEAKKKVQKKAPEKALVTDDMISTKTHINPDDHPSEQAGGLENDEEDEFEKERRALEEMYASYAFPPLDLLAPSEEADTGNIKEEIDQNAAKLVDTLNSFHVKTSIADIRRGPRITRYELVPEAGVRIRAIANLVDDISMNLASAGIRIEAPIPGKAAVGVEVPNKIASTVRLRELLENESFKNAAASTTVCVGADVTGSPVFGDLAKMPHTLIAGATGMGKSVCINVILMSLLYKARPDDVKLILVDPKKVELGVYNGIPHLLVPVVIDAKKATGALSWAVCEMERRFDLIEEAGVREIKAYNKSIEEHPEREKLPHIIIVIDELNDLMMVASDSVEASICRIAQKARAAGIHLIIGTQRPSVDVITGTIKANIPSRIAFHVASQIDSRTILDTAGAEKLLNNGDMLFAPVGVPKPLRVQGAFVSDSEVEKVTSFLKQNTPAGAYNRDIMEDIEREAEKCAQNGKRGSSSDDVASAEEGDETLKNPKFREACEVAIDEGKISTSLLQRRLKIGFGKAARFIDIMQRMGIVSSPDGQKPRTTLMTRDQFYELLNHADDRSEE
ncbi:MAG: DNA translocase FtsK [Clostridia bacterium]|nr:DNA translocase FtsK [Clostridia bacterium]